MEEEVGLERLQSRFLRPEKASDSGPEVSALVTDCRLVGGSRTTLQCSCVSSQSTKRNPKVQMRVFTHRTGLLFSTLQSWKNTCFFHNFTRPPLSSQS